MPVDPTTRIFLSESWDRRTQGNCAFLTLVNRVKKNLEVNRLAQLPDSLCGPATTSSHCPRRETRCPAPHSYVLVKYNVRIKRTRKDFALPTNRAHAHVIYCGCWSVSLRRQSKNRGQCWPGRCSIWKIQPR